jgi:hypothetical protein
MLLGNAAAAHLRFMVWCKRVTTGSSPIRPRWLPGTAPQRPCSIGAGGWSVPTRAVQPGLITGGDLRRLRHLRQPAPRRRSKRPKAAETLGSFTARYEISYRRLKPRSVRRAGPRRWCDTGTDARWAPAEFPRVAAGEIR